MHGWLILDKPLGLGSTQCVSAVKRALRESAYRTGRNGIKVGHGGTLDPLATGVLPIALGEATKLAGRMLDASKIYEFTVTFGIETDTLDLEGEAVATTTARPSLAEVEAVLRHFTGPIAQVPPAYSALKIGGERAYDLARAGEDVVPASRPVTVHSLTILHPERVPGSTTPKLSTSQAEERTAKQACPELPRRGRDDGVEWITLIANVTKGTYIRSLARDIARALGTVGHVSMLRRTHAGPFGLSHAISLDKLAELGHARGLEAILLPLRAGLDDIPALSLSPDQAGLLRQGRVLIGIAADDGPYFALSDDVPVALVEVRTREVRVVRGFNL